MVRFQPHKIKKYITSLQNNYLEDFEIKYFITN